MTDHRARVLRIERTFDATAEQVFDAWTSEELLRRWLHGMPGWETPTADVECLRGLVGPRLLRRRPSAPPDLVGVVAPIAAKPRRAE